MYFPRAALPNPTIKKWAQELVEFDAQDVVAGIGALGRSLARLEPTLAEIIAATHEARSQRAERERQEYVSNLPRIGPRESDAKWGDDVNREGIARLKKLVAGVGRSIPDASDAGRADVG